MGLFSRSTKTAGDTTSPATSVTLDDGTAYAVNDVVDCIGDSCPRPQLMTKKAMSRAESGDVVEVRVDNPTSMEAIPPMMGAVQGTHLGTVKAERHWRVILRKN